MHSTSKLGSFMALRADGWSLDKISRKINVPRSTLWTWDVKNRNEIQNLRQIQLERIQEQILPSHEELKSLTAHLTRINEALARHDLSKVPFVPLMQVSLQIRDRLSKMRERIGFTPVESLPLAGCIAGEEDHPWVGGDPAEGKPDSKGQPGINGNKGKSSNGPTHDSNPIRVYTAWARQSLFPYSPVGGDSSDATDQN